MTSLFLDLVQDLREKRLWPVAVALLAATAAVPLVLLKPAHTQPGVGPTSASGAAPEGLPVVNVSNGTADPSKLNEFAEKNPFKPMAKLKSDATAAAKTSSGSGGASTAGTSGGGSGGSGGAGGSGGSAGGGTPSTGGGTPADTSRKYFAFRVNLRFGPRGHEKSYKDVKQLSMLPDSKSPVIIFMGMSADFKTAVFMIDASKYQAAGEGNCKPSPTDCSFVELSLNDSSNEETLATPDGSSEYTLKLTGIKRVFLTPDQAKGDAQDENAPSSQPKGKAKAKAAGGNSLVATGGKADGQDVVQPLVPLFELPSFASQG